VQACALAAGALGSPSAPVLDRAALLGAAADGIAKLMTFYNSTSGFFGPTPAIPFWTTANAIETLSNYAALTSWTPALEATFRNTHDAMIPHYCGSGSPLASCYNDDHLWWTIAWSRAYEVSGIVEFLDQSRSILAYLIGPEGAWNETCGGVNWALGKSYVNAIPNELFLSATGKLANLTEDATPVANFTYAQWAEVEWSWFSAGPMMTAQPGGGVLVTDGLEGCGPATTAGYFTYNQGVLLSGLAYLTVAKGDPSYAAKARTIADTAIAYFDSGNGVMFERGCGGVGKCNGADGKQFKGVFIRHLAYALKVLAATAADPVATSAKYTAWVVTQAQSILAMDSQADGEGLAFGQLWQGPFAVDDTPWVSQAAALDALLATLMVL